MARKKLPAKTRTARKKVSEEEPAAPEDHDGARNKDNDNGAGVAGELLDKNRAARQKLSEEKPPAPEDHDGAGTEDNNESAGCAGEPEDHDGAGTEDNNESAGCAGEPEDHDGAGTEDNNESARCAGEPEAPPSLAAGTSLSAKRRLSDAESDSRPSEEAGMDAAAESDEDDFAPELPPAETEAPRKKRRVLEHEKLFLDELPSCDMYERSYMHRDTLSHVLVTKTDFVITASVDGHLKFWKKTGRGIEFVKHYRAHLESITSLSVSADGALLATVSTDKAMKVFDVIDFDMINMITFNYTPQCSEWVQRAGKAQTIVAVSDQGSPTIRIYDGRGDGSPLHVLERMHAAPVVVMKYNPLAHCVVSADKNGMMEYWTPDGDFKLPKTVAFEFKSETDLYEFRKNKCCPSSLTFSPDYSLFATLSQGERQVRVFRFATGKLLRKYDESLRTVTEMQQVGSSITRLDDMEFGRRLAVEREMEKNGGGETMNAVFDETGNFLIYPSILGIKIVNIQTNKVVRLLGRNESQRYLCLSLYQGAPKAKQITSLAQAASDNPLVKESRERDPTLFCTAYKRNRFYMFTQREPDSDVSHKGDRDIFNEKPSREEQTVAAASQESKQAQGTSAILRTTMGDIHIRLFPAYAPKAVENFVTHARNGYYNNLIFHRVIKGFMIQTGCPFGDGTGGESIWGHDFEDEFHKAVKHDRPYTVSMANAGPKTNASQFFITVAPTPWLDNKHTIFGRVTAGMDVVHDIENVRTDKKTDKPFEDINIVNIEVR